MYLGGGGSAAHEERVWKLAFGGADSILYWPFALPDERLPAAARWFSDALKECGIRACVTVWETLAGHHATELASFDVIAVGGGLTSKLAGHVRAHHFGTPLTDYIRSGGTYYGGSAGAILPCADISLAAMVEHDPEAATMPGLGLLNDVAILPHADVFAEDLPEKLAARLGVDVVSLPENSGLRTTGSAFSAIGPGIVRRTSPDGSCRRLPEVE